MYLWSYTFLVYQVRSTYHDSIMVNLRFLFSTCLQASYMNNRVGLLSKNNASEMRCFYLVAYDVVFLADTRDLAHA